MLARPLLVSSAVLLAIAVSMAGSPAHAQDAQNQAAGRALFNEGMSFFTKGDYESACPKFEASLKAFPGIGTRGKLAECYEKSGRYASAWLAYREVAQLATRTGDPTREQIAAERAKSLEPKLSYVTIVVSPQHDVPGLVVKRGGKEVERAKLGAAEPVDSGTIPIEASAPGKRTFTGQIAVMNGQSARFEVPALESTSVAAPVSAPVTMPAGRESTTVHGDPPSWQKPTGLVLMGVGAVALGVGAIFGLAARSKYDGAFESGSCDRGSKACDEVGQNAIEDANSKATLSTIMFVAGGGLAVAGLVVFLTAPSARSHALRIAPTTYAGGGGLMLGGSL
jgi:hypothetical protein